MGTRSGRSETGDDFHGHVPNMVTAVLADYRAFDTLGEVTVIFTGAVAVLLILRSGREEDDS